MEIWKTRDDSDHAEVSNLGRIRRHGKIVNPRPDMDGYPRVTVGGVRERDRVHRFVAECFVPNPEKKRLVNHIDGRKDNCRASNLEWVSEKENSLHAERTGLLKHVKTRWVAAQHVSGGTVLIYPSQHAAARALGISDKDINKNLCRKRKTTHGYRFCYLDEQERISEL